MLLKPKYNVKWSKEKLEEEEVVPVELRLLMIHDKLVVVEQGGEWR